MTIFKKPLPRVAILMATHDGIRWIDSQLKSILNQENVEITLFISDDGSIDGTYAFLKKISARETRIVLLPKGKLFKNAARNFYHLLRSVDFKAFDYVALSDQDDIWAIDKLSRAVHQMNIQNATCYSSDVLAFWENGKTELIKKSQEQVALDYLFESAGPGCTFLMTRDAVLFLKKHLIQFKGETDKILHHDWLIYVLMRSRKFKWVIDDYIGVHYRQHEENEMGAHLGLKASIKRIKKIFDGSWLDQVRLIASLCGEGEKKFIASYLKPGHERYVALALRAPSLRRRCLDASTLFFMLLTLGIKKLFTKP